MPHEIVDMLGFTSAYLTVIGPGPRPRAKRHRRVAWWTCRCTCGVEVSVSGVLLRSGRRKACGTEGHFFRRLPAGAKDVRRVWDRMKQRCYNPKHHRYDEYGGRGIYVCDQWLKDFAQFAKDMGPRPSPMHSIERLDNDGPYSADNCVWALHDEQLRNRRTSRYVMYEGHWWYLADLAAKFDLSLPVLSGRLKLGWTIEQALGKKKRPRKRNRFDLQKMKRRVGITYADPPTAPDTRPAYAFVESVKLNLQNLPSSFDPNPVPTALRT